MILATVFSSPIFLAAINLSEDSQRSGIPLWVIPAVIFIVLLLIFLSSYFSSTGIQGEKPEATAVPHESPVTRQPEPTALQVEIAPTALADAPETAVTVPEKVETAVAAPAEPPTPPQPDNLKKVEGIGPKIERILHEAGILTFAQLAAADVSHLEKVVREDAGIRIAFPDTWPEQAKLAAEGAWDALEKLQDALKGGRRA